MKLKKMFTCHGPMWIDADQYAESLRKHLTIYTSRGNKKFEVAKTQRERDNAAFGVHRNNLFNTLKEALENRERIYQSIFNTEKDMA